MNDERDTVRTDCAAAREALHELFDEDGPGGSAPAHLDECSECRDWARDLGELRRALRGLDQPSFPDDALARVWERTVDAPRAPSSVPFWTWAAAAAVLVAVIGLGLWNSVSPVMDSGPAAPVADGSKPTDEEIRRAAEDVRMVFALASRAVRRSERAAVDRVLAGEVAPALDRIVVDWPGGGAGEHQGRNGV